MSGFAVSSGANPNVVKTALDGVFFPAFNKKQHPNIATAESDIFQQMTSNKASETWEIFTGTGYWQTRGEEQDVPNAHPSIGQPLTATHTNWSQSIDITKNLFDDAQWGVIRKMTEAMALSGRKTRDKNAMGVYRLSFTTQLTADGAALVSDSHTNGVSGTVDNKITAALSTTSLETAIVTLAEQIGQDGTIGGFVGSTLVVPMALYKEAVEITESKLEANTADNNLNVFSAKYGIKVVTSPFLGAAAGGSDTAWWLIADEHSVLRFVRQAIETAVVDYKFQRNNNYIFKGEFRESYMTPSYEGIVGSTGTT